MADVVKRWLIRTNEDARLMLAELRQLTWNIMTTGKFPVIAISPESRSAEQNRLMWPLLTDVSNQVVWPTGSKILRSPED